ncbi:rhomboid family intramembrane serine protease [Euryarchaeota archaeon ex4484_178]|nr:MAG: rhomboid family intramembrane serine protease [Euryarchaeota archaeon ex4484_178]
MLYIALTLGVIIAFTLLALRRNALIYISLALVLIYFLEIFILYSQGFSGIEKYFHALSCKSSALDIGILTSIYLHSLNPAHIFSNILIFFLIGLPFERKIGSFWFTLIFLISGIAANIGYSIFLSLSGISSYLLGASGAIFGVMGAFLILYPNEEIAMFLGPVFMPRIKVKYAVLSLMAVEFLLTFLWVNDNVAHGAHVIGAVAGALMGYFLKSHTPTPRLRSSRIDYELLESMSDTEELRNIVKRIRVENDELIQNSWIEEFFRKKYGDAKWEGKYIISGGRRYRIRR